MTPRRQELPYFEDSAALYLPWADRPWAVFLDSGFPHARQGRFDIIAAEPTRTLTTRAGLTEICDGDTLALSADDPFQLVKESLGSPIAALPGLPFCGGAIGFFAYDLCRQLEKLPQIAADTENMPEMAIGLYEWAVVVDHREKRSFLVGFGGAKLDRRWPHLIQAFSQIRTVDWQQSGFSVTSDARPSLDLQGYLRAFDKIQHYIQEGDCYQVNLALQFTASCQGNPWPAYQWLRARNPAPFGAYLNFPQVRILSSSPERFLKVTGGLVETKPIKGTRPRSADARLDAANARALSSSTKDRAENLMIVDLLRNDLGKNCKPGSVRVPKLFDVESYPTVHHLVSTIQGQLAESHGPLDLLRGCFPGGSITGAPKIRAMEIIEELEPNRRGIYCGAIGYIGFDGNMDTNIAIRTLVNSEGTLRFRAGGGIVADSVAEQEYQECYHKAAAMLQLVEQFSSEGANESAVGR